MFSPELLFMLLKNIQESDPESLPKLRVVSKQFNSIIVPIVYHHVTLTPKLIQCLSNNFEPKVHPTADWQVTQNICRHTRHIAIKESVECEVVINLLRSMDRLESFTWLNNSADYRSEAFARVAHVIRNRWPRAGHRLHGVDRATFQIYAMWQFYHLGGESDGIESGDAS